MFIKANLTYEPPCGPIWQKLIAACTHYKFIILFIIYDIQWRLFVVLLSCGCGQNLGCTIFEQINAKPQYIVETSQVAEKNGETEPLIRFRFCSVLRRSGSINLLIFGSKLSRNLSSKCKLLNYCARICSRSILQKLLLPTVGTLYVTDQIITKLMVEAVQWQLQFSY